MKAVKIVSMPDAPQVHAVEFQFTPAYGRLTLRFGLAPKNGGNE